MVDGGAANMSRKKQVLQEELVTADEFEAHLAKDGLKGRLNPTPRTFGLLDQGQTRLRLLAAVFLAMATD